MNLFDMLEGKNDNITMTDNIDLKQLGFTITAPTNGRRISCDDNETYLLVSQDKTKANRVSAYSINLGSNLTKRLIEKLGKRVNISYSPDNHAFAIYKGSDRAISYKGSDRAISTNVTSSRGQIAIGAYLDQAGIEWIGKSRYIYYTSAWLNDGILILLPNGRRN